MSRIIGALLGIALSFANGTAQRVAHTATGQRVRITSGKYLLHQRVGTLVGSWADSITVRIGVVPAESTLVLSRSVIDRLEVSRGLQRNTGRGALIGLGSGAALGAVIGLMTYEKCVPQGLLDCLYAPESRAQQAMLFGVAFGLIGAGVGALVGSAKQERWERVRSDDDVAWSIRSPPGGGIGVDVGIRF